MGEPLPFLVRLASQRRAPRPPPARAAMGSHSPTHPPTCAIPVAAIAIAIAIIITTTAIAIVITSACHACHAPIIPRPAHRLPRRPPHMAR
jgi:hypothetical protein